MKLYTFPALHRASKCLIAAQYAQQQVDVVTDASADQLKGMSVWGKVPALETDEGVLSESNAIARYIARLNKDCQIYGKTMFESAQIDSWMDWCAQELEIPATMWVAPVLGWMDNNPAVTKRAQGDFRKAMAHLEKHLKNETFLVGNCVTLADIALATTMMYPLKLVVDEKTRKPFPCVMRWFMTCVNQPEFAAVIGSVALCVKPLVAPKVESSSKKPATAEKKSKKGGGGQAKAGDKRSKDKQSKSAASGAKPAAEEKPKKKAKNPLELLPKSDFVIDNWKRTYSNAPDGDCFKVMPEFYASFDPAGWSLWFQDYQFDDENTVTFMTSNLVSGFVQRCDEVRKYAFGCMQVIGQEGGPIKIKGAWVIRGDSIKPMLDCNPDAEYYTWTKVHWPPSDEQKTKLEELWCAWETVQGLPCLDSKVFK